MSSLDFGQNKQYSFNFRASSLPQTAKDGSIPSYTPPEQSICPGCALLDFETAFSGAYDTYEGARRGHNNRALQTYRSRAGPAYIGDFYFVASLGNRLAENRPCKLCGFMKLYVANPLKGPYKLLAVCSSEISLFEARRKNAKGRWIKRPG